MVFLRWVQPTGCMLQATGCRSSKQPVKNGAAKKRLLQMLRVVKMVLQSHRTISLLQLIADATVTAPVTLEPDRTLG
jgi:hypothetical protein